MPRAVPKTLLDEVKARQGDAGLRFDEFMELVLYDETRGFYATQAERAGRGGDFLTSPEVSPLFGATVAAWIEKVTKGLGPGPIDIVEVGAGPGTLGASIMAALPPSKDLRYHLVERGAAPRASLKTRFAKDIDAGVVTVHEHVEGLPTRIERGVFVSNELFDNLPVRRVMMGAALQEIRVRVERNRFQEVLAPADAALIAMVKESGVNLAPGQSAEVCPAAVPLLESILSRFTRGALLGFDYGGDAGEVSGEHAPNGTIAAYRGHRMVPDLYADLGQQDITAHVNFTPLVAAAKRLGYSDAKLARQSSFLVENGLAERFIARLEGERDDLARLRMTQQAKLLYHPEGLGDAFRVLHAVKRD